MRKLTLALTFALAVAPSIAASKSAGRLRVTASKPKAAPKPKVAPRSTGDHHVQVKAHTTKSGTRVPAHERTAPNKTQKDNWSTKGNANPHTRKAGTKPAMK